MTLLVSYTGRARLMMSDDVFSKVGQMVGSNFLMPRVPIYRPPLSEINPAAWMYERIVKPIIDFEQKLDSDQEIGARLVSFTSS